MNRLSLVALTAAGLLQVLPSTTAWSTTTSGPLSSRMFRDTVGRSALPQQQRTSVSLLHLQGYHSRRRNSLVRSVQATAVDIDDRATEPVVVELVSESATTTSLEEASLDVSNVAMDAEAKEVTQQILNAVFLAACFGWAAYTIFNIDDGMTRGWTQGEIAMRIPLDNWSNYERSLMDKPVFTKTLINVVIYLLGDWLSQTVFQKKDVLDFDVSRTLKNGFIGLCFGPLVHQYYEFSDTILPVEGGLMNRVEKILMDQTLYLTVKCSIYIFAVGVLSGDDFNTAKQTVKDKIGGIVITAWKFWPLVHCVTYGLIPARHRILWVNSVDLIWNAILASQARKIDPAEEAAQLEAAKIDEIKESVAVLVTSESMFLDDDPLAAVAVPAELASVKKTVEEIEASDGVDKDAEPIVQEVDLIGSSVEISKDGVPVLVAADDEGTEIPIVDQAAEAEEISKVAP